MKPKKQAPPSTWTITSAALECGVDPKTLRKRLAESGERPDDQGRVTLRQIVTAITGDAARQAKAREATSRAALAELELAERRGQLWPKNIVLATVDRWTAAARTKITQSRLSLAEKQAILADLRGMRQEDFLGVKWEDGETGPQSAGAPAGSASR